LHNNAAIGGQLPVAVEMQRHKAERAAAIGTLQRPDDVLILAVDAGGDAT